MASKKSKPVWVRIHKAKPRVPGQSLIAMNWDLDSPHAERIAGDSDRLMDVLRKRGAESFYPSLDGTTVYVIYEGPRGGEPVELWILDPSTGQEV